MQEMNTMQARPRFFLGSFILAAAAAAIFSSAVSAGEVMPPIRLVDSHTAGVIPKGYFAIENRLFEGDLPDSALPGSWLPYRSA